jgi:hypothetical protein
MSMRSLSLCLLSSLTSTVSLTVSFVPPLVGGSSDLTRSASTSPEIHVGGCMIRRMSVCVCVCACVFEKEDECVCVRARLCLYQGEVYVSHVVMCAEMYGCIGAYESIWRCGGQGGVYICMRRVSLTCLVVPPANHTHAL